MTSERRDRTTLYARQGDSQRMSGRVRPSLLSHEEMPCQMRELFIHTGYRPLGLSVWRCLASLCASHNEMLNIWTHMLPGLYYVILLTLDLSAHRFRYDVTRLPVLGMMVANLGVFAASTNAHTFCCLSIFWKKLLFMADYCGIIMSGIAITCAYCVYLPPSPLAGSNEIIYVISSYCVTVLGGVFCCWSMMTRPDWESGSGFRVLAIAVPYLYASLPVYCVWTTDLSHIGGTWRLSYELTSCAAFAILSALFKATHIPERWFPGRFDIVGHSHQFFHIFTFLSLFEHHRFIESLSHLRMTKSAAFAWQVIGSAVLSVASFALIICLCAVHMARNREHHERVKLK